MLTNHRRQFYNIVEQIAEAFMDQPLFLSLTPLESHNAADSKSTRTAHQSQSFCLVGSRSGLVADGLSGRGFGQSNPIGWVPLEN